MRSKYAYYNEHDPNAAQWIRELIKLNQIAPGEVDERSIVDVQADDLRSFRQWHFFGGVGVWSYVLRQAGWDDDREVFSGSAPCQSFSAAGLQRGFDDKRHLWPHMFRLIRKLRPSTVIGEQVSSKLALQWWDLVAGDLESADYATAAFDLSAASCGAPHHRSRLFWVANANQSQRQNQCHSRRDESQQSRIECSGVADGMADTTSTERGDLQSQSHLQHGTNDRRQTASIQLDECGKVNIMAHANGDASALDLANSRSDRDTTAQRDNAATSNCSSSAFWNDAEWYPCRDGKYRPSGIGINPLAGVPGLDRGAIRTELEGILYRLLPTGHAIERTEEIEGIARLIENSRNWGSIKSSSSSMDDGATTRVGYSGDSGSPTIEGVQNTQEARIMRLKGYGNAIVAPLATEFIRAVIETQPLALRI